MSDKVVALPGHEVPDVRPVADFLRELADALDRGDEKADGCVVVIGEIRGANFRTATRKHGLKFLESVGLLHTALYDVQRGSVED